MARRPSPSPTSTITPTPTPTFTPIPSGLSDQIIFTLRGAPPTENVIAAFRSALPNLTNTISRLPQTFSIFSEAKQPRGLHVNSDGTEVFVVDSNVDAGTGGIYKYTMSTPWDLSTMSYSGESVILATNPENEYETFSVSDISFNADGTQMYLFDNSNDTLYQYDLTAYDLSTVVYSGISLYVNQSPNRPYDGVTFAFGSVGYLLFVLDNYSQQITQFRLDIPYDISSANFEHTETLDETATLALDFSIDGNRMFVDIGSGIQTYKLATKWDVRSASKIGFRGNSIGSKSESMVMRNVYTPPPTPSFGTNGFNSRWDTTLLSTGSSNSDQVKLPLKSDGFYRMRVYWGDGTSNFIRSWDDPAKVHTYPAPGIYTINIVGTCQGWEFPFQGTEDVLKLLEIYEWGGFAFGVSGFNAFRDAANLFITATDVPDLTGTTSLSGFLLNTPVVTIPSLADWDISDVTSFRSLFNSANSFNDPGVLAWDTSNVTDMVSTFGGVTPKAFNQPIGVWNVSNVTEFRGMFGTATSFNQPLNNWDTSSATDMRTMFINATSFNQPLNNWDTSKVTDMRFTFSGATSFDQDLSSWNVTSLTQANNMFDNSGLSTANYDALLVGWEAQDVQNDVVFGAGATQYTPSSAASAARQRLIDDHNWTITDGGPVV